MGTFDPALFIDGVSNEIRANNGRQCPGAGELGFNVPSLIAVFDSAPYLHSGAAPTLDAVLENVTHRNGGPGGRPGHPHRRRGTGRRWSEFLKSIDRPTEPFTAAVPPPASAGTMR